MGVETIHQKIKRKNMILGVGFGLIAAFFIRDEFYFPTYEKIDELVGNYKIK